MAGMEKSQWIQIINVGFVIAASKWILLLNICQTSYITTENLFSSSKRKEFNSEVLAQNIQKVELFEVVK